MYKVEPPLGYKINEPDMTQDQLRSFASELANGDDWRVMVEKSTIDEIVDMLKHNGFTVTHK